MIAIIDYGVGNLFSLKSSLDFIGLDTKITNNEKEIREADAIILPGVGAFRDAIEKLGEKDRNILSLKKEIQDLTTSNKEELLKKILVFLPLT